MLVGGLLPLSDHDLNGQWLGCPPEGDAGQGSRACLHPGVLPFRGNGASLPLKRARHSHGRLVLTTCLSPAPWGPVGGDQVPAWPSLDAGGVPSRG